MEKKKIKSLLFFLVMGIYVLIPFYMVYSYHSVLIYGNVYRFKPAPVDPYDAFRGKYITLYFMQNNVTYDSSRFRFSQGETAYLQLKKDSSGYAVFTNAFKTAPEEGDYLKTEVSYEWTDTAAHISFDLPFDRYYLPEEMAKKAEDVYFDNLSWQNPQADSSVYVDVKVKGGKAIIEELYFQGIPVKEYIHQIEAKEQKLK